MANYLQVGVIQYDVDSTRVVKPKWGWFHMEANFIIFIYNQVWEHDTKYSVRQCKKSDEGGICPPPPVNGGLCVKIYRT